MQSSIEQLLEILFDAIVFMIAVSFIFVVFHLGYKYNDVLIERFGKKSSTRYAGANYGEAHPYISPYDSLVDILATDPVINIQIDGSDLSIDVLNKARNNDSVAIQALKMALDKSRYYKVTTYDYTGTITLINYIGG